MRQTAKEMVDKLMFSNEYRLALDVALFLKRCEDRALFDVNDLLSGIYDTERISPHDVRNLAEFMGVTDSELLEEYCVLVNRNEE